MKKKGKFLVLGLSLLVCLTACSNSKSDSQGETNTTKQAKESKEAAGIWPLTYTDAAGRKVVLEEAPKKIAVDYLPYWEYLLALDLEPAAASMAKHYQETWDGFKGYNVSAVKDLGEKEINLEKLAEVAPDVLFVSRPDGVENLEKVTNVIVMDGQMNQDWRYGLTAFGKILGREKTAATKTAEIEKKLAKKREELASVVKDKTFMHISIMGTDKYYICNRKDFFDSDKGLGLTPTEGYPEEGTGYQQVTLEKIAEMNPDYVFLNVFDGDEAIADELMNSSLFKSTTASKESNIYKFDGTGHSLSILATEYTFDKMAEFLLNQK
ncbi:ABC transporter substrate-binding protein [Erwinia sp. CPCC 100877]|nr:ABC transporter substrate-binding protein [Erwinia sp. CPCC 100877]